MSNRERKRERASSLFQKVLTKISGVSSHWWNDIRRSTLRRQLREVLESALPCDHAQAEADFELLQSTYAGVAEYGYDSFSTWRRATERFGDLLKFAELQSPGADLLDVGCGDGMLAVVARSYGHRATNADSEDWRNERAMEIPFHRVDVCKSGALPDSEFDLICSFNSFEHFPDPRQALANCVRACRPNGLIALRFCPLYSSPWGLHAYRSLMMPYPQFLFSDAFTMARLTDLGIQDLGRSRIALQYVNRWRVQEYLQLFELNSCEVIELVVSHSDEHLDLVARYPESFRGRGLTLDDLTATGISVTLRKSGDIATNSKVAPQFAATCLPT